MVNEAESSTKVEEGFDDLMKATKERNSPQPSGGAGVKKGKAYGGSAQKDQPEHDTEKKEKKKKSLKDWFEKVETEKLLSEAEQITMEPAKQSTQVIKQGTKTLGTVSNPALAATIKSAIGKGEMSLAGDQLKEEEPMMEKAPPGMEDVVLSLKKKFPGEEGRAYAIAWSMYNKKHGKNEAAEDNPESAMLEQGVAEETPVGLRRGPFTDRETSLASRTKKTGSPTRLPNPDSLAKKPLGYNTKQSIKYRLGMDQEGDPSDYDTRPHLPEQGVEEGKLKEKWAGDAEVKPTGQYKDKTVEELKSMLAKLKKSGPHGEDSPEAKKQRQINFALRAKGGWKKGEGAAMKEAELPSQGPDYGAGLGRGRSQQFESKQVNESMNTLEAAYHEGKSHGLSKHGYACRYNEGSEEHKRYHDGFKEGLDECYGLMPNRGLVVSEVESEADVVDNMASYGAEEGALGEMNKTQYMKFKAKETPGPEFNAFGQTHKDSEVLEMDAFAFESLDKQLNALLTEGEEPVSEGLSVNMSQGLGGPGGMGDDSVSVSATGDDAGKLLDFIKQVGLGGLGGAEASAEEPKLVAQISDYGAPKFAGYDNEPKSMMDLMKVMSGGDDYKDEEGQEHDHDHAHEEKCDECGTMMTAEGNCDCDEGKEMVDEVESEDQMEYQVAEDDGEGNIEADEQGAQIDAALAVGSENEKSVNEDGMESSPEAAGAVAAADAAEEEEAAMSESSFLNLYKKIALIAEESTKKEDEKAEKAGREVAKDIEDDEGHKGKDDDKAEKAGKKVTKDIEYDDKKDKKEKVDEWANDAGKDGTQQTFERDIEFMTKVIAGGLNKPKATGQTTIPVIAGQDARTGDEDVSAWKRLAGIGK